MICYLDTSVVLRRVLGEKSPLRIWGKWSEAYSSDIMRIEALRAIDRMRLLGDLDDDGVVESVSLLHRIRRHLGSIKCGDAIFDRAADPFPVVVKTLDAIHLAAALAWRRRASEPILFVTHDEQQAKAATVLGFDIAGV